MSKPTRCHRCKHTPRRIVSVTSKRNGGYPGEPKQHKKGCDCLCHIDPSNRVPAGAS